MLDRLLTLDPARRISARDALAHSYFHSFPLACSPANLPKIQVDTHEYQVVVQLANERFRQFAGARPPPVTKGTAMRRPQGEEASRKRGLPHQLGAAELEPARKLFPNNKK